MRTLQELILKTSKFWYLLKGMLNTAPQSGHQTPAAGFDVHSLNLKLNPYEMAGSPNFDPSGFIQPVC